MKTIMVSGRNFKCSLEMKNDSVPDDSVSKYQLFLGMMMKLSESTFYANRVPEVSEKIGKIIREESTILKKLLEKEQNNENPSSSRRLWRDC